MKASKGGVREPDGRLVERIQIGRALVHDGVGVHGRPRHHRSGSTANPRHSGRLGADDDRKRRGLSRRRGLRAPRTMTSVGRVPAPNSSWMISAGSGRTRSRPRRRAPCTWCRARGKVSSFAVSRMTTAWARSAVHPHILLAEREDDDPDHGFALHCKVGCSACCGPADRRDARARGRRINKSSRSSAACSGSPAGCRRPNCRRPSKSNLFAKPAARAAPQHAGLQGRTNRSR